MPEWHKMDLVPKKDLVAWYQIDPATNTPLLVPDFSDNGRNLTVSAGNEAALAVSPLNGELGYYFDGSNDPYSWSGSVTAKHIFTLLAFDRAGFVGNEGVISGLTSGNILTSQQNGSTFYPFGTSGYSYRKADVAFDVLNMQAPVAGQFALVELVLPGAGVSMDGIRIGQQLANTARRAKMWWMGAFIYSTLQTDIARLKLMTYHATRFHVWPKTADGLNVFPFPANRTRGRDLGLEHYLSEPYEGAEKALVREEIDAYDWQYLLRIEQEYNAAVEFYRQHNPVTPFVMRDYRCLPPVDTTSSFASEIREQGSDVTWRFNYSFATKARAAYEDSVDLDIPPTNWADLSMGGKVYANRSYLESRPEQAFNGVRHTQNNWAPHDPDGGSGGWDSGADALIPAVLVRDFEVDRRFSHSRDYTLRDVFDYADEPSESEGTTLYGVTTYALDYWTGTDAEFQAFLLLDNGELTASSKWVEFVSFTDSFRVARFSDFPAITSSKIRYRAYGTADHPNDPHARLVELEVWSRNPATGTPGPLESLQRAIIANQWPNGLPIEAETSFTANGGPSAAWAAGGDSDLLTFDVFPGLTLNGYVFSPVATPPVGGVIRNAWIINIHGHETIAAGITRTQYFVDRGFHVILLGMPNYEPNSTSWTYAHSMSGNITITNTAEHAQFASVIEPDGTPILPLFLDQVFRAANWIRENHPAARIHLTGHSGGGFMCSMAAALDDRKYFTVKNSSAGELPFSFDTTVLDVEQRPDRPWWLGRDWPDLYKIAARLGLFTKSHSEGDPAFPAFQRHHIFRDLAAAVNAAIAGKYSGRCDIYVDTASMSHAYTDFLKQKFVDDCISFEPGGSYLPLDLVTTPVWAAYGAQELLSTYHGPIYRVRDSLGVEVDIGLTGTPGSRVPDSSALTGNGPYRYVLVYDQMGNQEPVLPFSNDLTRAPYLQESDMSVRFVDTGDPNPTAFQLPDMSGLTEVEIFMKRKLKDDPILASDGVGGWWNISTSTDASHTPYEDGNFYDQTGSTTRRTFANTAPLDVWHVMHAWSAPSDWGFGIDGDILDTDSTNTVGLPTVPVWGAGLSPFTTTYGKGWTSALVITKICTELDRISLAKGL